MKKVLSFLLIPALLLGLCACAAPRTEQALTQPFDFYYRSEQTDYDAATGALGVETRDLGRSALTDEALVRLYLEGPQTEGLVSPFPPNVELLGVSAGGTLMTVRLSEEYSRLQGVDASIADACIAKTLLGLSNVRRVRIVSLDQDGGELRSVTLDNGDIQLSDNRTDAGTLDVTLYFADAEGRYLLPEKRSVAAASVTEQAKYLTEQLLAGPQTAGLYPTLPVGTMLLDINVENGVCAVDLSAEFLKNYAALQLPPHLTLLSLANTLTELDGVDQIRLYVEGRQEQSYGGFPLTQDYTAELRAVGPSHPELNELDGLLYLPMVGSLQFYTLPLRIRSGSNESSEQTLLRVLFTLAPQNGLENPWFEQTLPQSVTVADGVCTLDFAQDTIPGETAAARALSLSILYLTLSAVDGVEQVQITVGGKPA